MKWKRIDLFPPWRQDPQLWTDLLSPNKLWHLSIFGYDDGSSRYWIRSDHLRNFQAYLEHSDLYYKLLSDEIDRELVKLEQAAGLIGTPKNISARSRKSAIGKSIAWANQEISKFDDKVFTSKFDSAGRFRLNQLVEKGDREAKSYIKSYFEKLEDRLTHGTKPEKHKALNSIIFILGRYPNWRPFLPDNLHTVADELEARGILITDDDVDPEVLSSIRKRNPKKASDARSPIGKCQSLWEKYCKSPTKKNLKAVFAHLEAMKSSKNEKVKKERTRCLRTANKEAKRLGLVK